MLYRVIVGQLSRKRRTLCRVRVGHWKRESTVASICKFYQNQELMSVQGIKKRPKAQHINGTEEQRIHRCRNRNDS